MDSFTQKRRRILFPLLPLFFLLLFPASSPAASKNVLYNNTLGLKGGYYLPQEQLLKDIYEEDSYQGGIFYDRRLFWGLSFELEASGLDNRGKKITSTGGTSETEVQLLMAPVKATVKWNLDLHPFIVPYIGLGGDYWLVREKTKDTDKEEDRKLTGYHGRLGIRLLTMDRELPQKLHFLLEGGYSKISPLKDSDIEFSGWTFSFGVGLSF